MDSFSLAKVRNLLPSLSPSTEDAPPPPPPKDTPHTPSTSTLTTTPPAAPALKPGPKSNLDLIDECDSFPYFESSPDLYLAHTSTYYHFRIASHPDTTLGYVSPSVAEVSRGLDDWELDDSARILTLTAGESEEERSAAMMATAVAMRATGHFEISKGWRNESYPVYGPGRESSFSIERAASASFGVVSYGVHMTAYVRERVEKTGTFEFEEAVKIWVPRRARSKQTYGGMSDNTVAGGIATGEKPFESVVRESAEEASSPEDSVRQTARAAGAVSYFHIRDERAGGETRLLQPEVQYIYDLESPAEVTPKPSDDEVEEFYLWSVEEIQEAMKRGEFKPNCALVLVDFFVRHGILTEDNEKDYTEIVSRSHRRFEFPTK